MFPAVSLSLLLLHVQHLLFFFFKLLLQRLDLCSKINLQNIICYFLPVLFQIVGLRAGCAGSLDLLSSLYYLKRLIIPCLVICVCVAILLVLRYFSLRIAQNQTWSPGCRGKTTRRGVACKTLALRANTNAFDSCKMPTSKNAT